MKIEIDAKEAKEVLLRAKKHALRGKITYQVEIVTEWESWSNTHVILKTDDYQEALGKFQLLVGALRP